MRKPLLFVVLAVFLAVLAAFSRPALVQAATPQHGVQRTASPEVQHAPDFGWRSWWNRTRSAISYAWHRATSAVRRSISRFTGRTTRRYVPAYSSRSSRSSHRRSRTSSRTSSRPIFNYVPPSHRPAPRPTMPFHPSLVNPSRLPGVVGGFSGLGRTIYHGVERVDDGGAPIGPPRGDPCYIWGCCPWAGCGSNPPTPTPRPPRSRPTPTPRPPSCTPTYAAPSITGFRYDPNYPLVVGQDTKQTGVTLFINAQGGTKTNNCPRGGARQRLSRIVIERVDLAGSSRAWITNELAHIYPGARVQGRYPLHPVVKAYRVSGASGSLTAWFLPHDPGYYQVRIRACQADGKCTTRTYSVPVHLLEISLVK